MKLNKDLIMQMKTAVWARTREESDLLRQWADGEGLEWRDGDGYLTEDYFDIHECFCYNFFTGLYGNEYFYESQGYTILTIDEIIITETN